MMVVVVVMVVMCNVQLATTTTVTGRGGGGEGRGANQGGGIDCVQWLVRPGTENWCCGARTLDAHNIAAAKHLIGLAEATMEQQGCRFPHSPPATTITTTITTTTTTRFKCLSISRPHANQPPDTGTHRIH